MKSRALCGRMGFLRDGNKRHAETVTKNSDKLEIIRKISDTGQDCRDPQGLLGARGAVKGPRAPNGPL